jgi:hypothetical protein
MKNYIIQTESREKFTINEPSDTKRTKTTRNSIQVKVQGCIGEGCIDKM